MSDYEIPL